MALINKDLMKGRIIIYSISGCSSCAKVKSILMELNFPFYEIDLALFPDRRQELYDRTSSRTVPHVFFNEKHIGGYQELRTLFLTGELESILFNLMEQVCFLSLHEYLMFFYLSFSVIYYTLIN